MKGLKRALICLACIFTLFAMLVSGSGCGMTVYATDLMEGIEASGVVTRAADDAFKSSQMAFALALFKQTAAETEGENLLISPLSVMLALAMTANGADGETRTELERTIGGGLSVDELNEYLYSYVRALPSAEKYRLSIANSIWFRQGESFMAERAFLQKNADYYGAAAYASDFDRRTVRDINNWVKKSTDGMIDRIVDEIGYETVMFLINAVVFDAEWQKVYERKDVFDGSFTLNDGTVREVEMMRSDEWGYLSDGMATGFAKRYRDGKYSFVALLPNEGVSVEQYIAQLEAEKVAQILENREGVQVNATMPKFEYEYEISMNNALNAIGITSAFDSEGADFSKIGSSSLGNIYIGDVLHKTFISVDERGTRAGAVTKVQMDAESAGPDVEIKTVVLDRPFVYMIIDNACGLPIFVGAVMDIGR